MCELGCPVLSFDECATPPPPLHNPCCYLYMGYFTSTMNWQKLVSLISRENRHFFHSDNPVPFFFLPHHQQLLWASLFWQHATQAHSCFASQSVAYIETYVSIFCNTRCGSSRKDASKGTSKSFSSAQSEIVHNLLLLRSLRLRVTLFRFIGVSLE